MSSLVDIQAGGLALDNIRANGLPQESVKVIVGASGGPKWFVLSGLDKALLGEYFRNRTTPLDLIGTSAGSWRFSCFAQDNPLAAHERFEQGYLHTCYSEHPDPSEISRKARELVASIIPEESIHQILNNPVMRFNLIAVRSHGLTASDVKPLQMAGLGLAATGNLINRKYLSYFFTRTLFHHSAYEHSEKPEFYHASDLTTERVKLSAANLVDAVMASGSIPVVMESVTNIAGAPEGRYRDGGITDYHFDMRFHQGDGLVLYPHFYSRMIPGWFDKALKHRRPSPQNTDNVVLVSPSQAFVDRLPYQKIPDRNDFARFTFDERVRYWKRVVQESTRLGEEFLELVASGKIRQVVNPI
ncbi:patatin-like phospholipase family protein [Endozoicomonas sp.]|uniref:patatin-like phospholipase family protein n=1 Tax=Endozoicomonas sp. TaxID=1892382 RepID=UPI00383B2B8B